MDWLNGTDREAPVHNCTGLDNVCSDRSALLDIYTSDLIWRKKREACSSSLTSFLPLPSSLPLFRPSHFLFDHQNLLDCFSFFLLSPISVCHSVSCNLVIGFSLFFFDNPQDRPDLSSLLSFRRENNPDFSQVI